MIIFNKLIITSVNETKKSRTGFAFSPEIFNAKPNKIENTIVLNIKAVGRTFSEKVR